MKAIVFLIEQMALGLYILTGITVAWTLWRLRQTQGRLRATHFELERDIYRYKRANAFTALILLIEFGAAILGIQQVIAPAIRNAEGREVAIVPVVDDGFAPSPTPPSVQFGKPPIDASGVQIGATEVQLVLATPTLTPTPVGTILPNPPPVAGCDTPGATLQVPANGMLVFEPLNVIGTANSDNFAFYRFELNGPQTFGNFAILRDYTQPVPETSTLGQFVPSFYQPGAYQFRLTVFDSTNALRAACTVNITISEPIPTPTPLSGQ